MELHLSGRYALLILLLSSFTTAIPTRAAHSQDLLTSYDYGVEMESIVKRQVATSMTVTGAPMAANGSIPVRKEIRELQKDAPAWNLYLLGLDMMQAMRQDDINSWYSIMGMHVGRKANSIDI